MKQLCVKIAFVMMETIYPQRGGIHEQVYLLKREFIRYKIREDFGGTLGWSPARFARVFCNEVYLSYLIATRFRE